MSKATNVPNQVIFFHKNIRLPKGFTLEENEEKVYLFFEEREVAVYSTIAAVKNNFPKIVQNKAKNILEEMDR